MQEYAEVEDLLESFELNRREHITCMLRLEHERPSLCISTSRAPPLPTKSAEPSPLSVAVLVFAPASPLLQLISEEEPSPCISSVDLSLTVAGARNFAHLLAAHSNQLHALSLLAKLAPQI